MTDDPKKADGAHSHAAELKDVDIESLKKNKIPAPAAPHGSDEASRIFLPTLHMPMPTPPPEASGDEAYGGSGEKPATPIDPEAVKAAIVEALKTVYDPEIPVNIFELGLIYDIAVSPEGEAEIEMTLTAPACPVAGMLVQEVAERSGEVEGVATSHVKLVWDPPWTKDRMSEDAMLELGLI